MWRLKSQRPGWIGAGLLAAGIGLAACGGSAEPAPKPSDDAAATQTAAEEQTLTPAPDAGAGPRRPPTPLQPGREPLDHDPFLPLDAAETPDGTPIIRSQFRPRVAEEFTRWRTNWNIRLIDVNELVAGGIPRDGIESIDAPKFESIEAAAGLYAATAPVIVIDVNGDVRAYPLQILSWHEVVNDVVGGVPLLVSFCPLCNSALAYERTVAGEVFEFGVSGALRNSDLVMYDRTTESLWQQIGGRALVGDMVGAVLQPVAAPVMGFAQFAEAHPNGLVLSQDTGTSRQRDYSVSAYRGYDSYSEAAFDVANADDRRLDPFERVVALVLDGEPLAYPFSTLSQVGVINDRRGDRPIVVFWAPGSVSVLDQKDIAASTDVGSTGVFIAEHEGAALRFRPHPHEPGRFVDRQTQSTWTLVGEAVEGPLTGARLQPVIHANHFWFAWVAFQPQTLIVTEDA